MRSLLRNTRRSHSRRFLGAGLGALLLAGTVTAADPVPLDADDCDDCGVTLCSETTTCRFFGFFCSDPTYQYWPYSTERP